jgi:hypothetical protein
VFYRDRCLDFVKMRHFFRSRIVFNNQSMVIAEFLQLRWDFEGSPFAQWRLDHAFYEFFFLFSQNFLSGRRVALLEEV